MNCTNLDQLVQPAIRTLDVAFLWPILWHPILISWSLDLTNGGDKTRVTSGTEIEVKHAFFDLETIDLE